MVVRYLDDVQQLLSPLCVNLDDEPPLVIQTQGVLPLPVSHQLFEFEALEVAEILRIGDCLDSRHDFKECVHHRTRVFVGPLLVRPQGLQLLALELKAQTNPLPSTTEAPELFTPGVNGTVAKRKGGHQKDSPQG